MLQAFLAQLPVAPASASCQDSGSDSEEEGAESDQRRSTPVSIAQLRAVRSSFTHISVLRVEVVPDGVCVKASDCPGRVPPLHGIALLSQRGKSWDKSPQTGLMVGRTLCLGSVPSRVRLHVRLVIARGKMVGQEGMLRRCTCCVPGTRLFFYKFLITAFLRCTFP